MSTITGQVENKRAERIAAAQAKADANAQAANAQAAEIAIPTDASEKNEPTDAWVITKVVTKWGGVVCEMAQGTPRKGGILESVEGVRADGAPFTREFGGYVIAANEIPELPLSGLTAKKRYAAETFLTNQLSARAPSVGVKALTEIIARNAALLSNAETREQGRAALRAMLDIMVVGTNWGAELVVLGNAFDDARDTEMVAEWKAKVGAMVGGTAVTSSANGRKASSALA